MFGLIKSASNLASVSVLATAVAGGVGPTPGGQERGAPRGSDSASMGWGGEGGFAGGRFGERDRREGWGGGGVRVEIGGGHRHREVEVIPARLEFEAFQTGSTVVVMARGHNATGGFTTYLEREVRPGTDHVVLRNIGPGRGVPCTQALSAFDCAGSFRAYGCVREVTVHVAGRAYCVPVRQVGAIGGR